MRLLELYPEPRAHVTERSAALARLELPRPHQRIESQSTAARAIAASARGRPARASSACKKRRSNSAL
jgi:hypothetical protein